MNLSQKLMQDKYSELCSQLGDLQLQRKRLDKKIQELEDTIDGIDKSFPILTQLERQLIEQLQANKAE